jgi:hypothetical protein
MADYNHLSEAEAIRELARHTEAKTTFSRICHFVQYQYYHWKYAFYRKRTCIMLALQTRWYKRNVS